jgi:hypothetical protein
MRYQRTKSSTTRFLLRAPAVPGTDVIEMLIAKSHEDLPAIRSIKLLNPENNFLRMKEKLRNFNNLRVLLAYLLDRGEAILYHRLSSVVKVISIEFEGKKIVIDYKGKSDILNQTKNDMQRITGVEWSIATQQSSDGITYSDFLNTIDEYHQKALLQTDIVKYILSKFDDLKVEKITLNNFHIN